METVTVKGNTIRPAKKMRTKKPTSCYLPVLLINTVQESLQLGLQHLLVAI